MKVQILAQRHGILHFQEYLARYETIISYDDDPCFFTLQLAKFIHTLLSLKLLNRLQSIAKLLSYVRIQMVEYETLQVMYKDEL